MNENKIKNASMWGLFGNLFLLLIKGSTGLVFHSKAMIADAVNSAGDIFASIMSFFGSKISIQPADDDHNMGHGKAEYIFSLFIGISMIIVAFMLINNCLTNQNDYKYSIILLLISLVTIIVKLTLYIYTKKIYQENKSILLKSLFSDHFNDILITSGTLLSIICSKYDVFIVDKIVAILISFWIMINGIKIVVESYNVLIDQSIDIESQLQIEKIVKHNQQIKFGRLGSMPIGNSYIIVLTIYVSGDMTTREAHQITKELQNKILKKVKHVDRVIIHVNPID